MTISADVKYADIDLARKDHQALQTLKSSLDAFCTGVTWHEQVRTQTTNDKSVAICASTLCSSTMLEEVLELSGETNKTLDLEQLDSCFDVPLIVEPVKSKSARDLFLEWCWISQLESQEACKQTFDLAEKRGGLSHPGK